MKKLTITILILILSFALKADTTNNNVKDLYGFGASFARLAEIDGTVNVYRDSYEVDKAERNLPLNSLDIIKTSPDSRAVIQFIDGSLLKIGEDTKVELLDIDGSKDSFTMLVRLWKGKVYYDIADSDDFGERTFRIDTEDCSLFFLDHGQYRVDKNSFETDVKVVSGKAEVDIKDGAKLVRSGEYAIVNSTGRVQTFVFNTFDRDDFDIWAANSYSRKVVVSEKYVPREIRHYVYELDSYGTWVYDDDLTVYVWHPYIVDTDWIPYSYGRWVWSPFGMTWVSYYPWGYAPFHYGYWDFSVSFGWVWVPDVWYSPAWVSWAYWDNYVGWYPYCYRRGTVVRYPVRNRRWVYAPINRFNRRDFRPIRGVIPANRRVVRVRKPILVNPVSLRRNPKLAIRRAIERPVTRKLINSRFREIRKREAIVSNRTNSLSRNRNSNTRIISRRNGKIHTIRNPRIIDRNSTTSKIGVNSRVRSIRSGSSGHSINRREPVIINRNSERKRSSGTTYRQKTISGERNTHSVRSTQRTIRNNNSYSVYHSRNTNRSNSYNSNSNRYSSHRESYHSHTSRLIRVSPRRYSVPHYSHSSRRSIRRRR